MELPSIEFSYIYPTPALVGMNMCVYFGMGSHITLVGVEQVIGSSSHEQWDVWQPNVVGKCMEI